jgi:hypothetical protein
LSTYTTAKYALPAPNGDDPILNGDNQMRALADAVDLLMATDAGHGILAARPAAAKEGRWYKETDGPGFIYRDTGAAYDPVPIGESFFDKIGVSTAATVRRGKANIATSQNTTATSYAIGNLTTPDRVQNVVLPTDGLLLVAYQAIWQNTVSANARAAIFLGANQVKLQAAGAAAPVVQEATGPTATSTPAPLSSYGSGLVGQGNSFAAMTEVTTGQMVAPTGAFGGGFALIFAAAGTYDVSVQFKNQAAGTLTVSNRHLWVEARGY